MNLLSIENYSFWDRIGDRPVIIYGTGNGADKIIDELLSRKITPSAVFASDGFVRDRYFRGYRVNSYADVIEKYVDFLYYLDQKHDLIIPEGPLFGGGIFDSKLCSELLDDLKYVHSLLFDDCSKELFCDAVNFRLTGKMKYLMRCQPFTDSLKSLVSKPSVIVDGGAYSGDSTEIFLRLFPYVSRIYAFEPDPGSYRKLLDHFKCDERIVPVNSALSDKSGFSVFFFLIGKRIRNIR